MRIKGGGECTGFGSPVMLSPTASGNVVRGRLEMVRCSSWTGVVDSNVVARVDPQSISKHASQKEQQNPLSKHGQKWH